MTTNSCSSLISTSLRDRLTNRSDFNSTLDLETYLCQYATYIDFRAALYYAWGCCSLAFRSLGIISSFLTLGTLCRNQEFTARCFVYYKAIAVFEFFYNLSTLEQSLESIYTYEFTHSYRWCYFGTIINNNIGNIFPHCTDTLTIFLSIERAVACLLPTKFHKMHNIILCVAVFVIAVIAALLTNLPPIFSYTVDINPSTGTYFQFPTDFGKSETYGTYDQIMSSMLLIQSCAVVVCTAFAIAGMIRAIIIKRRLFSEVAPLSEHNGAGSTKNEGRESIRQSVRLCFLHISLALPICINKIAYYVTMKNRSVTGSGGLISFYKAYLFEYLALFTAASDVSAYSLHFYFYVIFSKALREQFMKRFLRK